MNLVKLSGFLSIFLFLIFTTQISNAATIDTSGSEPETQIENEIQNNDELPPKKQSDFSESSSNNSSNSSDQQENKDFSADSETTTDSGTSTLTIEETSNTLPTTSTEENVQEETNLNETSESQETTTETTIPNKSEVVNDSTADTEITVDEYMKNVADFNKVSITDVENLFYTEGETMLYIGRPTCYYCRQFSPELKQFNELIGDTLSYYDIDGTDFDEQAADLIFTKIGIPGTPTTMYIKNGQIISAWVGGAISGQELYNFLYQNKENLANSPDKKLVGLPADSNTSKIKDVQENEIGSLVKISGISSVVNSTLQTQEKRSQIEPATIESIIEQNNVFQNIKLSQSKNETNGFSDNKSTLPKLNEKRFSLQIIGIAFLFLTGSLFISNLKKSEKN